MPESYLAKYSVKIVSFGLLLLVINIVIIIFSSIFSFPDAFYIVWWGGLLVVRVIVGYILGRLFPKGSKESINAVIYGIALPSIALIVLGSRIYRQEMQN